MSRPLLCVRKGCDEERVSGRLYCEDHLDTASNRDVSDDEIAAASIPDAVALLREAKRRGLIRPTSNYVSA